MTLKEYLSQPHRGFPQKTLLERLAELTAVNERHFQITGWGIIDLGGPYGRIGLTAEEAWELLFFGGVVEGFSQANGKDELAWLKDALKELWDQETSRIFMI